MRIALVLVALLALPAHAHESRDISEVTEKLSSSQSATYDQATARVTVYNFRERPVRVTCVVRMTSYWSRCCANGYEETYFEATRSVRWGRILEFKDRERTVDLSVSHVDMYSEGWEPTFFVDVDSPHCHARRA